MNNHFNSRDIELLSAYLDNQLSSKERTLLETRLKADPALRRELQEINKTRLVLRQLPRRKAPRNYYIRPDAVRSRPALRLAPLFGVISAVASVLLSVVLISSRLVPAASPVAMAPAAAVPQQTLAIQQETGRNILPSEAPTEAAPEAIMSAPSIAETPTPFIPIAETSPTAPATPTTIYLFAFPPTSTPEGAFSISGIAPITPTVNCEDYYGTEPLPNLPKNYGCPTPTGTSSQFLQGMLPSLITTTLPTETATPLFTGTSTPTGTASPTPSPTPTETPSPTLTPLPSPTPEPTSTENPAAAQKSALTTANDNSAETSPPGQVLGAGAQVTEAPQQSSPASPAADYSFLNYLLLSFELSLAAIAIIAGITAVILRIRSR